MKAISRIVFFTPFFLYLFFILEPKAYGYLDPGTGSYILQLLIAGIASAVLAMKIFWEKAASIIKGLFGKRTKKDKMDPGK